MGHASRHRRRECDRRDDGGGATGSGARAGEPRASAGEQNPEAGREFLRGGTRPPTPEVVAFIDANKNDIIENRPLGVEPICSLLRVAPSPYYAARGRAPSVRAVGDAVLTPELVTLWVDNCRIYEGPQAVEVRPPCRDRYRSRSDRPAHAHCGDRESDTHEACEDDQVRSDVHAASGPGQVGVHRDGPEPAVGHRPHVCPHLSGRRLRLLDRRRVLADARRAAVRVTYADGDGAQRDRDGTLGSWHSPLSQWSGQSIHVDSLRRTAHGDRHDTVDRNRQRQQ